MNKVHSGKKFSIFLTVFLSTRLYFRPNTIPIRTLHIDPAQVRPLPWRRRLDNVLMVAYHAQAASQRHGASVCELGAAAKMDAREECRHVQKGLAGASNSRYVVTKFFFYFFYLTAPAIPRGWQGQGHKYAHVYVYARKDLGGVLIRDSGPAYPNGEPQHGAGG